MEASFAREYPPSRSNQQRTTMDPKAQVTLLLRDAKNGHGEALDLLIPIVYDELRRLAAHYLRDERAADMRGGIAARSAARGWRPYRSTRCSRSRPARATSSWHWTTRSPGSPRSMTASAASSSCAISPASASMKLRLQRLVAGLAGLAAPGAGRTDRDSAAGGAPRNGRRHRGRRPREAPGGSRTGDRRCSRVFSRTTSF
jgi:hypothetical protein